MKTLIKLMDLKTLVAGIIPVVMGTVYGFYHYGKGSLVDMLVIAFGIILIQSCANMINDYYDFRRGADTDERMDEKVLAAGEASPEFVKRVIVLFLLTDLGLALYYALRTHLLVFLVAIAGTVIMYFYSAGNRPISHTFFGEFVAGGTMGLGILTTVIYIQTGHFNLETILVALPTSIYIGTILLTNNISDHIEDRANGRETLPIKIGIRMAEFLWIISCHSLLTFTAVFVLVGYYPVWTLILAILLFPFIPIYRFRTVEKVRENKAYLMGLIGKIGLRYHVSIVIGLIIGMLL